MSAALGAITGDEVIRWAAVVLIWWLVFDKD